MRKVGQDNPIPSSPRFCDGENLRVPSQGQKSKEAMNSDYIILHTVVVQMKLALPGCSHTISTVPS
jgi:hypothetical protein